MTKVKVCHFVNIITGKTDGVYAHLRMLFKYVDGEKFQQFLIFQGNPEIEKEAEAMGVKVYVMKSLDKKFSLKSFMDFYSFVQSQKIDIIHTHFLKPYAIGGLANIFLRRKMIFNYHGLFINNVYNTKTDKIFYSIAHLVIHIFNSVDLAIAPSHASKELLYRETTFFPQIKNYYNGYDKIVKDNPDVDIVNCLTNIKKSSLVVGIVARMDLQKRIDISLKIAEIIMRTHKNVYFIYFGDGPLENEMKSLASSLGLGKNVAFMGFVPNAKLYMKYFDLLLFTSDWEALPLTVWDAMASGVPIVSTDVGGIKEIVVNENCGVVYPTSNIEEACKLITSLVDNKTLRKQMSINGKVAINNKYNEKNFSKFFNSIYAELSAKH